MSAPGPPSDGSSWAHGRTGGRAFASGESPKDAGGLVGRDQELGRVLALLEAARAGLAGAVVVEGEAGIGKTSLLRAAEDIAGGFACLWARGVESEAALGHAALLELLTPVRDRLADLPAAQAEVLAAALGWGPVAASGDRYLVAAATLSLLAAAAQSAPVLVLVDDLQWVDRESAAALLFAARRLHHDAVAFLFAVRPGPRPPASLEGLPALALAGLVPRQAAELLPVRLADPVVARLVERTRGNPLALNEVASHLTPAQRLGAAPLPDPLPVGDRLELVYEPLLTGLSAPAWRAVLLCAASSEGATAVLVSALRQDGVDPDAALDEAEERGVLVRDRGGLRFRHPLLRAATWRLATPAQRRAAHLALECAALLTTDPGQAAERLAAAVGDAFLAGDTERTRTLAARILDGPAGRAARAQVLTTLGVLEQYAGSVPRAAELLTATADLADGPQRVWALAELGQTRFRLGDLAGLGEVADRLAEAADLGDPGQRALAEFTRGIALTVGGDPAAARPLLTGVLELLQSPALRDDPRYLIHLALAAGFLGDVDLRSLAAPAEHRLAVARERGALGVLVPGLALMASGRAWLGDHAGAFADAGEAAELGEQLGYAADAAVAVEMLAWQSAARGLHHDARRALERARVLTDRAGTTSVAAHQAITAAFCALCRGDLAEVAALLEARIAADGGVGSMGEPLGVAPTLVEAYVGLGRAADAAALAQRYAAATPQPAPPRTAALVARCRGLTAADDEAAVEAFEVALAAHAQAPDTLEAARTRLLYGARLRRAGRRVAARQQLRVALDAFTVMELTVWAQRAADELAATGATARPRRPLVSEALTSQETRVALLVARGLPNREVAAALFLSPKTVEHHLASVFRKRGFRSRTELAAAFARAAEHVAWREGAT
jgi:DNA-binding NarL/FixJ family response regulator